MPLVPATDTVTVVGTDDPRVAHDAAGEYLRSRPIGHNVALTVLANRLETPSPGRYWWVAEEGEVCGYAWHSPTTFKAGLTPMDRALPKSGAPLHDEVEAGSARVDALAVRALRKRDGRLAAAGRRIVNGSPLLAITCSPMDFVYV